MRKPLLILLSLLFAGASLCQAGVEVRHDSKADFSSFHTFGWLRAEGPSPPDLDGQLRAAAVEELAKRGLRPVKEGETPDLLLAYNAGYGDILVAGLSIEAGYYGNLVGVPGGDSNVTAGILFYMTRPDSDVPVWTGWLVKRATTEGALPMLRKRAPGYARKILAKYPPK
jgi:hypothetical protein